MEANEFTALEWKWVLLPFLSLDGGFGKVLSNENSSPALRRLFGTFETVRTGTKDEDKSNSCSMQP